VPEHKELLVGSTKNHFCPLKTYKIEEKLAGTQKTSSNFKKLTKFLQKFQILQQSLWPNVTKSRNDGEIFGKVQLDANLAP
jgi:hypothetical protein